jgi:hypothetical protein
VPPPIYFGTPLVTSHDSVQILKLVYSTLYYQMRVAIYFSSEILFKALSDCSRRAKYFCNPILDILGAKVVNYLGRGNQSFPEYSYSLEIFHNCPSYRRETTMTTESDALN